MTTKGDEPQSGISLPSKETFRILHLEDLPSTAASVKQALIRRGFRSENIIQVGTVAEAKDAIEDTLGSAQPQFDLVIVDLYVGGDLWAGTKFLDFMKENIKQKESAHAPKAVVYSVVYSRFARKGSVYEKNDQLNEIINKLNKYKGDQVICDYFEKNEVQDHKQLTDFIDALLTNQ